VMAIAVCLAESGGNPRVWYCDSSGVNGNYPYVNCRGQYDRGMFQLSNGDGVSNACAFNAYCNGREAYIVSNGGRNWCQWATWTQGAYRHYMGVAQTLASRAYPMRHHITYKVRRTLRTRPVIAKTGESHARLLGNEYRVHSGDTLYGIASHYYDNGYKWALIFNDNRDRVRNPDLIYAGQILRIPGVVA
jgi:Lysozyme like domain/LysM domain